MTLPLLLTLLLTGASPPDDSTAAAATVPGATLEVDSLRPRAGARIARNRRSSMAMGATVSGYLSSRGLPPQSGTFAVTDTGLVFRSNDGATEIYPLVAPVRTVAGRRQASMVSLAYLDESEGRTIYVFRLDAGVFQTETPGALLEMIDRPDWVDRVPSRGLGADRSLVPTDDPAGASRVTAELAAGAYADTLYALFGRPLRHLGQVDQRGRKAGRLGEYLAPRDSLAIDPARMTSQAQLRHTLAHELGHRWQARSPGQLGTLWRDIPAIRDPRRYGHRNVTEHQAEAIAFAVHFLQATAAGRVDADHGRLLQEYDRMVPGTGLIVRYLALQPIYRRHPLRDTLTHGRQ